MSRPADLLLLNSDTRQALWKTTSAAVEHYLSEVASWPVTPEATGEEIRDYVRQIDFDQTRDPLEVLQFVSATNAGVIDDLAHIADFAQREQLWLHVDGAWGGAAILVPELRQFLAGLERADSITFDPHKWLSVPMAAGLFLTRRRGVLEEVFAVEGPYMPPRERVSGKTAGDPYQRSMQWSRRFIGLKLFMTLATSGWRGYEEVLRHQVLIGDYMREQLAARNWRLLNHTPLPVICFEDGSGAKSSAEVVSHVIRSGKAWVSTTYLGADQRPAIRACITNFRTEPADIDAAIEALEAARQR